MVGQSKEFKGRVFRGESGFTLIEMMVVVGIIAVLAAVIIPNIGKFIGSGEQGAKDAEFESVQTAMNAMMADKAVTTLTAQGTGSNSSNDWSALPTESGTDPGAVPFGPYMQQDITVYLYCWDLNGQLTNDPAIGGDELSAAC